MPSQSGKDRNYDIELTELTVQLRMLAQSVEKIQETQDGTMRTKGMRERITLAEFNIEANKQAFMDMQASIGKLESKFGLELMQATNKIEAAFTEQIKSLLEKNKEQSKFIDKVQPYVNVLAWLLTIAVPILMGLIITGRLAVIRLP